MGNLGATEILIIVFIILILFGGKKIPELAKGIGEGIRNFKKSVSSDDSDEESSKDVKKLDDKK